jgi:hypothetical protein
VAIVVDKLCNDACSIYGRVDISERFSDRHPDNANNLWSDRFSSYDASKPEDALNRIEKCDIE